VSDVETDSGTTGAGTATAIGAGTTAAAAPRRRGSIGTAAAIGVGAELVLSGFIAGGFGGGRKGCEGGGGLARDMMDSKAPPSPASPPSEDCYES